MQQYFSLIFVLCCVVNMIRDIMIYRINYNKLWLKICIFYVSIYIQPIVIYILLKGMFSMITLTLRNN